MREGAVSESNGDKARFGRERWCRTLRRKRTRELQKALKAKQEERQIAESLGRWNPTLADNGQANRLRE
jgi:hypothetical protein